MWRTRAHTMRAMTAPTAQQMLETYLAAELAVLAGKEVRLSINGVDRLFKQEDLSMIQAGRREWESKVAQQTAIAAGRPAIGGLGFGVASFNQPW